MPKRKSHAELQFLLDGVVASAALQPPVESRIQLLPFGELSWENFERLCARLIHTESAIYECSRYGKSGEDQSGIDIFARRWMNGQVKKWVYQCKRHVRFTPTDIQKAIKSLKFEADHFVVLLSIVANTEMRDAAAQDSKTQIWDAEDISRRLKDHPRIVGDFFGPTWRRAFCGDAASIVPYSQQSDVIRLMGVDLNHRERLFSNLLSVTRLPNKVFTVPLPLHPSTATTPEEIEAVPIFKATKNLAVTFADIRTSSLSALLGCDPKRADSQSIGQWLTWPSRRGWLRDLIYLHLRQKCEALGMAYDLDHRRFYFTPNNGQARIIHYQALKRKAKRTVAYPYHDKDTGEVRFWVHHAARISLTDFDTDLYLKIEPGYAFTKNGQDFLASEDIGPLATRRKSGERNQNVFNHIVFWSEMLAEAKGEIEIKCGEQVVKVSKACANGQAAFGVPSDSTPIEEIAATEDELDLEAFGKDQNEQETE